MLGTEDDMPEEPSDSMRLRHVEAMLEDILAQVNSATSLAQDVAARVQPAIDHAIPIMEQITGSMWFRLAFGGKASKSSKGSE